MNIGQAVTATGVSAKMIRYYESIGLVRQSTRRDSGYRDLDERDLNDLRFIKRARTLGFSVAEITKLLALWRDRERPSREVKIIAQRHAADLEARIAEMRSMADTLKSLADGCAGDDRPDCPILADLAQGVPDGRALRKPNFSEPPQ